MAELSWSLLNLIAWAFGLKAAHDLRREFEANAKTWVYLTWAIWTCLLMELGLAGAPHIAGLDFFSTLTGIASAVFLWLAVASLRRDIRTDSTERLKSAAAERLFISGGVVSLLASLAVARALPDTARGLATAGNLVEGAIWIVTSSALTAAVLWRRPPAGKVGFYMPCALGLAFGIALLGAVATPVSRLTGWPVDETAGPLLRTLFILTLVTTLYAMVLHARSAKLFAATSQLHRTQEHLSGLEKLVAVGTLAAGAAHDFNNSLTVILGHAELALGTASIPAEVRADVLAIHQAAKGAATLTGNLLGIARRYRAGTAYTGVADVLRAQLDNLSREFARHHIAVETRFDPAPSPNVDLDLLSQVCLNLYLNARDAMIPKGGGTLRVSLRAAGDGLEFTVTDTGTGIPKEFRQRIFQPLQTTKGDRGTGLGLSVSKSVIESMGGEIRYESVEGLGTSFFVTLPPDPPPRA